MKAGWKFRPLADIASVVSGGTPSKQVPQYWGGDIPWVSPKDMKTEVITKSEDFITPKALDESATRSVNRGSLLIVVRSGILARTIPIALAGCELTINQDLKGIIPRPEVDSRFLAYFLRSQESSLLDRVTRGATVHKLDTPVITSLLVPV